MRITKTHMWMCTSIDLCIGVFALTVQTYWLAMLCAVFAVLSAALTLVSEEP